MLRATTRMEAVEQRVRVCIALGLLVRDEEWQPKVVRFGPVSS